MAKLVLGIFHDRSDAEDAIEELQGRDYNPKDISVIMRDRREAEAVADNTGVDVAGGAAAGATTGAVVGGLAGLLAAVAIPGLGAFLIGGPIAAALGFTGAAASTVSGAATGALAGGLIGALTSLGLSDEDAKSYNDSIEQGGILVAVPARRGEELEVREILEDFDADQVKTANAPEDRNIATDRDESFERGSFFSGVKGGKRSFEDDDEEEAYRRRRSGR